jgi:hypothetical protein
MDTGRGNRKGEPKRDANPEDSRPEAEASGRIAALPDLMRRALSLGLSGFFLTEEAVRKALGDTLPKDWIDFAVDQSERTRKDFLERISFEIGRSMENVDMGAVLRDLLEGRTLEVKAEFRLREPEAPAESPGVQVRSSVLRKRG